MLVVLAPPLLAAASPAVDVAVSQGFIAGLFAKDPTLWGDDAVSEASTRLGWLDDPAAQRVLVEQIDLLRAELLASGVSRVILCGMGGSSLAPEVMARASGVQLTVVDTVHPDVLAPLLNTDLSSAAIVVSSKSGGTVETDSLARLFAAALREQGIDPRGRMVVVTDPGSPLDVESTANGYRVFHGNPAVGGRFSALTAFGLVPAGLAGVPVRQILDDAHEAWALLSQNAPANAGLVLGAGIAVMAPVRNKLLVSDAPGTPGFGNWVEQLVAESTGKNNRGLLPVMESSLHGLPDGLRVGPEGTEADIQISGSLGALFLLWEVAVSFASQIIGVNPFDQPDVESAKVAAREYLTAGLVTHTPGRTLGDLVASATPPLPANVRDLEGALAWLIEELQAKSYVGICVFGTGGSDPGPWRAAANAIEAATARPVTLGFGPRFLHSTGQFHKGGPREGVFLQIVVVPEVDLSIPGRDFTAAELLIAQAQGDAAVLAATGQRVLSVTVPSEAAAKKLAEDLQQAG